METTDPKGAEHLIAKWRERAAGATAIAERYEASNSDSAGNGFAFLKEARIWRICADELAALPAPLPQLEKTNTDEEVPHAFVSRESDSDIWCAHCEYHRDHEIHAAPQETRERPDLPAVIQKLGILAAMAEDGHKVYGYQLRECVNELAALTAALAPHTEQEPKETP